MRAVLFWRIVSYPIIWIVSFCTPTFIAGVLHQTIDWQNDNINDVSFIALSCIFATLNCIFLKIYMLTFKD
jgi:hypothetical protein